jgi:hypothetical protein
VAAISTISGVLNGAAWLSAAGFVVSGSQNEVATFDLSGVSLLRAAANGWDLTGSSFTAKMPSLVTAGAPGIELRDADGTTNMIRLLRNNPSAAWQCVRRIAGVDVIPGTIPDATLAAQPWVRIRESGGTIFWETSSTYGGTWTVRWSVAISTFPLTNLRPRFQISAPPTGTWTISNVNGQNAPVGSVLRTQAGLVTVKVKP